MMAAAGPFDDGLNMKKVLQSAVQSVQWTYIIFWQFCPQQQVLVWGDGYYNGAIKTRKTVQPVEVSTEEAALSRSEQLRELYDSLASGDLQVTENQLPTIRRPSVALSPEDLTESEWFYLMCVSFSFPPGVGLVGQAYAKQQQQHHLWLTGANEVDCKVFTRAILAKSARIQTVVCIPLLNGVLELGTTEKVEEADEFVQHMKHFFLVDNENPVLPPPKPALSAHSSNTTLSSYQVPTTTAKPPNNTPSMDDDDAEEEDDEDDEEEEEDDDDQNRLDFEEETGQEERRQNYESVMEANELLQSDIYEDIRFGSPNDGSSPLDGFRMLEMNQDESYRAELAQRWSNNLELPNTQLHASEEAAAKDNHYSRTVSTILHNQVSQWPDSHSARAHTSAYSTQSSFTTWSSSHHHHPNRIPSGSTSTSTSQRLLKYMLFTVPFLHSNVKSVTSRLRKTASHEELSANHVLAERRRREKLNERFIALRSLVPLVTKMDKASILDDTIEYVKQLQKKIQDLEARGHEDVFDRSKVPEKRKIRAVENGGSGGRGKAVQVEVSIIESDALVELRCQHSEGLLVDVMRKLRELGVEITTVQSSVDGGRIVAEIRAKVKVKINNGKKISIMQVKKAINQIISPFY